MTWFSSASLLVFTIAAAVCDLKRKKIPNGLLGLGCLAGIVFRFLRSGVTGLGQSLTGMALPIAILWLLFHLHMLGGGDLKLFAMVGAFTGPKASVKCVIVSFAVGAVIAVGLMIVRRNLRERLEQLLSYIKECIRNRSCEAYSDKGHGGYFCFSVPILISVGLYVGGFWH